MKKMLINKHLNNLQKLSKGEHSLVKVLKVAGFKETEVYCPICRKVYKDQKNIEFIEQVGECINCDHIRAENFNENFISAKENL